MTVQKRHSLKQTVENLYSEPFETALPRLVNEHGSLTKAAGVIGFAPNALRYWMQKLGYTPQRRLTFEWVKDEAVPA